MVQTVKKKVAAYARQKTQASIAQSERIQAGQEIGKIPKIKNPKRRKYCIEDFELYCKTYHAAEFSKPWAPYHKRTAERIQQTVEIGGWYAMALPRGGGKTTLCCCAVEWAALRGSHKYPVLFGANDGLAMKLLKSIKTQLRTNRLLLEDFPHAIYPIRKLDGEARATGGQRYKGVKTFIEWGAERIVFPWIPERGSLSNGVVLEAFGVTAAMRGLKHTCPDGTTTRPDLAVVDDPSTRESAKSPSQTQTRLEILTGDIAYLTAPGQQMPVFTPCTIMYEGDLADRILDRDKNPDWHGEKTKMVISFPKNTKLWDEYSEILRASKREDSDMTRPNTFLTNNWEAMHEGAEVSWEARKYPDELSALQHAMNLKYRDEAAFYAECQNEPLLPQDELELLSADEICKKTSGFGRRVVPPDCSTITAFTDVQKEHLFWMVCAWTPDFTGYVLDYGAWPDQGRNYFTRADIRSTLTHLYGRRGDESGIMNAALTDLGEKLTQSYETADNRELSLSRWCIDGNWRTREAAIQSFMVQSPHRGIITLTYGRGVRATERAFSEAQRAITWRTGPGWFWIDGPATRKVTFDANLWKKRVHNGLLLSTGSKGSIQLFKGPPQAHRMLADHLLAEKPVKVTARGRTVFEWGDIPGRDNEGLDCLVGCALGASIEKITPITEQLTRTRVKVSLAEMRARAQQRMKDKKNRS